MKDEAMKLALEALENSIDLVSHEARNAEELYGKYPTRLARIQGLVAFEVAYEKAITAIKQALAEQPAQRTWVGLTDEEAMQICVDCGCLSEDWLTLLDAIEAKLKEKNK